MRTGTWSLLFFLAAFLVHGIFLAALPAGGLDFLFHDATRDYGKGFDFFSIYQAGYNFTHGMSIYFGVRDHSYGEEFKVVPYFSGFRYLPIYAYTYGVALTLFEPWHSYWIWVTIVELLLIMNILVLRRLSDERGTFLVTAGMWLAYSPYYLELFMGQQSMVTVTLLTVICYGLARRRYRLVDGGYIASVMWKLNTLLAVPLMLRLRRFRGLLLLTVLVLLTSAPYFLLVEGSWHEFVLYFKVKMIADGPNSLGLWALAAMLHKRAGLPPGTLRPLLQVMTLLVLGGSGLVTFLNRESDPIRLLAVWISSFYLAYRYVWEHHYVIILPLLAVLWLRERRLFILAVWLLLAVPTPFALLHRPDLPMPQVAWTWWQDLAVHAKVLPVLALWGWLCGAELVRAAGKRDLWLPAVLAGLRGHLGQI
ncbi:DUF2029 domain-containing protein [bacterium]|nr:DUF2029 domain-containing protein [candidate division CSSED10-310 bacterium]